MKGLAKASVMSAFSLASLTACANDVDSAGVTVSHSGSIPSIEGTTQRFTGQVRIDPLFQSDTPSRLSGGMVTFEPGSRTAWHTHPLGQTLLVTSGTGWIQQWGQERQQIVAGDVVSIPAGVKHWHGATSSTGMTHIALQEALNGKNVNWLEQVTGEKYRRP